MVKSNINVEDFEDKKFGEGARAGRYTRFKTDQGWISSFDKPTIEKLKDSVGKFVSVEVFTDKNDKEKITKFYGKSEDEAEKINDSEVSKPTKSTKSTGSTTMYVSYVKDLIIAGKSLEQAIEIITAARAAFS